MSSSTTSSDHHASLLDTTVAIARRYRGPENSGNGGYSCGLLARVFDRPVEVTLKAPPPLNTPLRLVRDEDGARLLHGDAEIAVAREAAVDVEPPPAPTMSAAEAARARYVGPDEHGIPGCFVCGPNRAAGDGMRIFAGPDESLGVAATPWTPEPDQADASGHVAVEFLWSALDCPGYFGLLRPGLPALLGRMAAEIIEAPRPGDACIVIGWKIDHEGRKYHAGSAVYTADGRLLAKSRQTWIELRGQFT